MYFENLPLYPHLGNDCERDACVRVPVFGGEGCGAGRLPEDCACRRVSIENPCRPGERALVLLGVDDCGNLVVCVRREPRCACDGGRSPRPCPPKPCPPPRPRREGCRGRLYGSWR